MLVNNNGSADGFFRELSPKKRIEWRARYIHLIDIEEERLVFFTNKFGHQVKYKKMPWMHESWKDGLASLENVMKEKGELETIN